MNLGEFLKSMLHDNEIKNILSHISFLNSKFINRLKLP